MRVTWKFYSFGYWKFYCTPKYTTNFIISSCDAIPPETIKRAEQSVFARVIKRTAGGGHHFDHLQLRHTQQVRVSPQQFHHIVAFQGHLNFMIQAYPSVSFYSSHTYTDAIEKHTTRFRHKTYQWPGKTRKIWSDKKNLVFQDIASSRPFKLCHERFSCHKTRRSYGLL